MVSEVDIEVHRAGRPRDEGREHAGRMAGQGNEQHLTVAEQIPRPLKYVECLRVIPVARQVA